MIRFFLPVKPTVTSSYTELALANTDTPAGNIRILSAKHDFLTIEEQKNFHRMFTLPVIALQYNILPHCYPDFGAPPPTLAPYAQLSLHTMVTYLLKGVSELYIYFYSLYEFYFIYLWLTGTALHLHKAQSPVSGATYFLSSHTLIQSYKYK
jgi:hypothetical protein